MIDSISSLGSSYSESTSLTSRGQNSLSLEQQELLESVLSNYDSSSLSQQDASEIVSSFQEAGITASKSLSDAMDSLGFDAHEVGQLAGVYAGQGNMPPPPPQKEDGNTISDILSELLDYEDDEDSTTSASNAYSSNSDTSFETVLDYTSRILNLNDGTKDKVMDLFENYKPENTELSSNEVSNIIKNSLQDILGDENNYNKTSFYA